MPCIIPGQYVSSDECHRRKWICTGFPQHQQRNSKTQCHTLHQCTLGNTWHLCYCHGKASDHSWFRRISQRTFRSSVSCTWFTWTGKQTGHLLKNRSRPRWEMGLDHGAWSDQASLSKSWYTRYTDEPWSLSNTAISLWTCWELKSLRDKGVLIVGWWHGYITWVWLTGEDWMTCMVTTGPLKPVKRWKIY